jgi:TolB protein
MLGPLLQEPEAAHPDWSPVGDQIVYQSPKSGSWDLYLINADGSNQRQLTNDPAIEGLAAWSPDGQWVAYLSNAGGNWGIWLIRADGSQRQLLFAFDGGTFNPKPITPYFGRDWLDEQISWAK